MPTSDPRLPAHRPLVIAHRAGNSIVRANDAFRLGADMIEADIWLHGGRLEVRHANRLGPILWERWRISLGYHLLTFEDLLRETPDDLLLFVDLKGEDTNLGPAMLDVLQRVAPNRVIAVCGRNYAQMDRLVDAPNMILFYSVGEPEEWDGAWPRLEAMTCPALSLRRTMATPEVMQRLKAMDTTVICWGVNSPAHLRTLEEIGVDGATTDSADLIRAVVGARIT